ncbi:hypothetical protein AMK59_1416 [Oryctes borbonicus]|uniref:Uncharacterized protein n=1 Tax=Oryctes borbonicus TaxID=1629725 RepID=A0A0T6BER7_9SCAR|nr:hypothetical protein AMK59_1416 [Oryctes borbonicus]
MKLSTAALVILFSHYTCLVGSTGLREEFTWSRITYAIPESELHRPKSAGLPKDEQKKSRDVVVFPDEFRVPSTGSTPTQDDGDINKEYIYENNIPMSASRWKNKLFVTVPRRSKGIPSTLNYVPIDKPERHNVPLIPYPDLQTNAIKAPRGQEHIVSVNRPAVDVCDRLWMVDIGLINTLNNKTKVGPQRVVIIDLNSDKIIKTHNFKDSDLRPGTAISMTVVDVTADHCDDAYAYFPDLVGFGLLVYSLKQDDSWRVTHNYFYLEPQGGEFNIGGMPFQWDDGIFSVALTDQKSDGTRDAIFHAMAGTHLYSVSTKILRDKALATRSYHRNDFKVLGDRGPGSQTSATDLHKPTGIMFFNLVNQNAVGCWNTNKPFDRQNFDIVQKNDTVMIYPSDMEIYKDDLIVLTNGMPIFLYSSLNYDKTNFRVWMNNVHEAVKGTVCENSN